MFKTSVKGFNKSDVNNYIITMHRDFADEKESLEEELSRIRAEHRDAVDALCEKDALIDKLNLKLAESEKLVSENEKLSLEIEKLRSEAAALTAELSSASLRAQIAEGKVSEIKAKLDEATDNVAKLESALNEKKNDLAESISFNIPDAPKSSPVNKKDRSSLLSRFKKVFN